MGASDERDRGCVRQDAEAAAVVLTEDGHAGRTYELSGDEAHTLADLAAEISAQTGKDIPYKHLPESDYAGLLAQIGLPEGFAKALHMASARWWWTCSACDVKHARQRRANGRYLCRRCGKVLQDMPAKGVDA